MKNKCKIFMRGNKQAGITLVALVVTIVVLLILAGVSLNLVLSNNGIIAKAGDARDKYGEAKANDQTDLDSAADWIDDVTGANEPEIVEPENIEDWEYIEGSDGTINIKYYKGNDTTVIIPNYINGKAVKSIYSAMDADRYGMYQCSIWSNKICSSEKMGYWYPQETIKEVVISEGIERIGKYAFIYGTALEKATIPRSILEIGEYSFSCCPITEVTYLGTEEEWNKIETNWLKDNEIIYKH